MIHEIRVTLQPNGDNEDFDLRQIPANKLNGVLFKTVLPTIGKNESTWLHDHPDPKPFALGPIFNKTGQWTGLRYSTFTNEAADLVKAGWQQVQSDKTVLNIGDQSCQISAVTATTAADYLSLLANSSKKLRLRFLTATAFRQGPTILPLPLPVNVFKRPLQIWQSYAPVALKSPEGWLDWCREQVFVSYHNIRTVNIAITQQGRITGFIGAVTFRIQSDDETNLRVWQALGHLTAYCGVGHKTAMGLGAVEILS